MKSVSKLLGWGILLLFWAPSRSALAWQSPTVSAVSCQVRHEAMGDPSPIPGWCYWDYVPGGERLFEATVVDGVGTYCTDYWRVYCRTDSLGFDGTWPAVDEPYARSIMYNVDMISSLQVLEPTRLLAGGRFIDPLLEVKDHTITLAYPNGSEQLLVDLAEGNQETSVVLNPGIYEIRVQVEAKAGREGLTTPYEGYLGVTWLDPAVVAAEHQTWGTIKAFYLR